MGSKYSKSSLKTLNIPTISILTAKITTISADPTHSVVIFKDKVTTLTRCSKMSITEYRLFLNFWIVDLKNNQQKANISSKKPALFKEMMMSFMKC